MKVRVVTWNAEGMFVAGSKTRRATPHDAIAVIKRLNADIIFIPEFGDTSRVDETIMTTLHALGYEVIVYAYDQPEYRAYGAALITRLPLDRHTLHRFTNTGRQFIEASVVLGKRKLRVIGLHLDDRSEKLRLEQVLDVTRVVNEGKKSQTIILGDFNAMHTSATFARFARTKLILHIAKNFPHTTLRSVGTRVTQMAAGTTLEALLNATGLQDLDGNGRKTVSARQAGLEWLPSIRLAKVDWILGSPSISAFHYHVLPDVGSDHRPVFAILDIPTV